MRIANRMLLVLTPFLLGFAGIPAMSADDNKVSGRVVDEAGKPVADAAVGSFWRANGSSWRSDGKRLDLSKPENVKLFWGHLGEMEPSVGPSPANSGPDGRFTIKTTDSYFAVMAMDPSRRRGGIAVLPNVKDAAQVEIRLAPLIRVRGSFEGPRPGQQPSWTHVYIHLPENPDRPIDSTRLVSCGSFEAKFDVRLPSGKYSIQAYSMFSDDERYEGDLVPNREIVLKADVPDVDLGTLTLSPHPPDIATMTAKAKAEKTWSDYTQHYGEKPPPWNITDARGVSKQAQPSDFKGKWLLLDFWGFGCRPCLKTGLPRLMKFYEEYAAQRDRFEILAICVDPDGELKTMADVDQRLEPIVKHVWGGKPLPFAVMLDSTFLTWERYGLPGLGTVILIDPDGNLIKGDESVLAEKLRSSIPR